MVMHCSVGSCSNNTRNTKNISYFNYPKEVTRRNAWLKAVGREDLITKIIDYRKRQQYRICEDHFEKNCIKLSKSKTTKYLCDDAFPKFKLPSYADAGSSSSQFENVTNEVNQNIEVIPKYDIIICPSSIPSNILKDQTPVGYQTDYQIFCEARSAKIPLQLSTDTPIKTELVLELQETEARQECDLKKEDRKESELKTEERKQYDLDSITKQEFLKLCNKFVPKGLVRIIKRHLYLKSAYNRNSKSKTTGAISKMPVPLSREKRELIVQLRKRGYKISEIQKLIGVTRKCIYHWLRRFEESGDLVARHRLDYQRKTTSEQDAAIVAAHEADPYMSTKSSSSDYNISPATVRRRLRAAGLKCHIALKKRKKIQTEVTQSDDTKTPVNKPGPSWLKMALEGEITSSASPKKQKTDKRKETLSLEQVINEQLGEVNIEQLCLAQKLISKIIQLSKMELLTMDTTIINLKGDETHYQDTMHEMEVPLEIQIKEEPAEAIQLEEEQGTEDQSPKIVNTKRKGNRNFQVNKDSLLPSGSIEESIDQINDTVRDFGTDSDGPESPMTLVLKMEPDDFEFTES